MPRRTRDIALLDFNMPGRDGLALAAELRALKPDMPLALISANTQHEIVLAGARGRRHLPAQAADREEPWPTSCQRRTAAEAAVDDAPSAIALDELELDALTELVNIGVSRAAASLREMVGEQVLLSVPHGRGRQPRARPSTILGEREVEPAWSPCTRSFEGDISGRALLIFPETNSLELVRAVTGGELPLEDIIELEQEALAETGNIILNGCLATIANMLAAQPEDVAAGDPARRSARLLQSSRRRRRRATWCCSSTSTSRCRQRDIRGYIAMLMDMPSLAALKGLLREFIQRTTGEIAPVACHRDPEQTVDGCVFDAIDAGLIVLDADRRVRRLERLDGHRDRHRRRQRAAGRPLDEIFPRARPPRLATAVADALELRRLQRVYPFAASGAVSAARRAGTSAGPQRHGPAARRRRRDCLIQVTDVTVVATERERVLRERQNARYDAVVDSAPDAILTLDAEGVIQLANPAAAREFGYAPEELIGQPITVLFEDARGVGRGLDARAGAASPLDRPIELMASRKDGSPSYLEVSAARWRSESRMFVTAILRDVNERRAAEEALRDLNQTLERRVAETHRRPRPDVAAVDRRDAGRAPGRHDQLDQPGLERSCWAGTRSRC